MEADIVENDDIAFRQRRGKLGFDPGLEDATVHRCVDNEGRGHAMASEPGDEGLRPPLAEWRMRPIALAFG